MDSFVVGNMAWNAGLVGAVAFFAKRWMDRVETSISDNRVERRQEIKDVKDSIDNLSDHVSEANGRTSKLETKVTTQIALCKSRNEGRRKSDKCEIANE